MIRVAVAGAAGRMGREVVRAVLSAEDMALVAAYDVAHLGVDAGELAGAGSAGVAVEAFRPEALKGAADVLVDFTVASASVQHALAALEAGVFPVIGTTGMPSEDLKRIEAAARERSVGAIYAPNFSVGAVLMMHLAEIAARYLRSAEIIELHHDGKRDAPSGTALLTAQRINAVWGGPPEDVPEQPVAKARGDKVYGVTVHSVRLPGLVAHQEVIFGATGQTLSIRHDSYDRASFMPGVLMAIRSVRQLTGLTVGLDALLGL